MSQEEDSLARQLAAEMAGFVTQMNDPSFVLFVAATVLFAAEVPCLNNPYSFV